MSVDRRALLGILLLCSSCAPVAEPPSRAALAAVDESCARVHELWKPQLAALQRQGGTVTVPIEAWVEQVYRPHIPFWKGYLGDEAAFRKWVQRLSLNDEPRLALPNSGDVGRSIREVTARAARLARRPPPCSEWYVLFGPGWTNLGGMGKLGMVVDFLGMPRRPDLADFDTYLPHEINHLMWAEGHAGAGPPRLLDRIIDEGFATYFAEIYAGGEMTGAQSLGYSDAELAWALRQEAALWREALPMLESRDGAVINRYMAAGARPEPGAPGKLGYFLGYRIISAYVRRHGRHSWRGLYTLPVDQIFSASGYSGVTPPPR